MSANVFKISAFDWYCIVLHWAYILGSSGV